MNLTSSYSLQQSGTALRERPIDDERTEALFRALHSPMESPGNDDLWSNSQESLDDEMTIYLQVKKTVAMKVKRLDTIGSIKSAFCAKEGISDGFQGLFLNGDRLKDDQRVIDYGIRKGSTLQMVVKDPPVMEVLVVIPSKHKSISLEARTSSTVLNIKALILAKEGIQPDQYNLIYAGRMLEDDCTLSSIGISNEPVNIQLVFNPCDMISFSVVTPSRETVNLKVKVLYSVSDVKAIVGGLTGIVVSDYALTYQDKQLEDSKSLACYNVQEGSTLSMSSPTFQIFIKAWSGKTIILDVNECDTIELVKDKACKKLGAPDNFLSIVFSGKKLDFSQDLAYYNIRKDATLHMVLSPWTRTTKIRLSEIGNLALGVPNPSTTIGVLKSMIHKKITHPVKEIYFRGTPLKDDLSVAYYNISGSDSLTVFS